MPGALLEVKRLVDCAVHVEHEVNAQPAHVVQDLETLPARAADIVVINELVHDPLEQRQIPAATPDALDFLLGQACLAEIVAVWRFQILHFLLRGLPVGLFERREAAFHAVGIVAARVRPEHDARAGVEKLAGHNNLVALAWQPRAGAGSRLTPGVEEKWHDQRGERDGRETARTRFHARFKNCRAPLPPARRRSSKS